MQELQLNTGVRQQKAQFAAWVSSKPQKPDHPKPIQRRVILPFRIGILFVSVGSAIGVAVMWTGITLWNTGGAVAFSLLFATAILLGVATPIGTVLIVDTIHKMRYQQEMQGSGWGAYLNRLSAWKQEGRERFTNLAEHDSLTRAALRYHLDFD